MTSLLAAAGSMIASHSATLGEALIVSDGGYTCDLTGIFHFDAKQVQDVSGNIIEWKGAYVHFTLADLVLNGKTVTPKRGMRVTRSDGSVYQVECPGGTESESDNLGVKSAKLAAGGRGVMRLTKVKA